METNQPLGNHFFFKTSTLLKLDTRSLLVHAWTKNRTQLHDAMDTKRDGVLHTENVQAYAICKLTPLFPATPATQPKADQGLRSSSCTVWASLGSLLMPWIHLALIRMFSRLCFSVLWNSGFLRVAKKRENSAAFSLEVNWWPETEELDRLLVIYYIYTFWGEWASITSTHSSTNGMWP